MPTISSPDQSTLRNFPQFSKLGLLVFRPPIIASGGASGASDGATTISLSSYSETETPRTYYSVIAGSSAGNDDGGKTRLKSISGNQITLAANNIEWGDYPFVSILRVIEPWSILPDLKNDLMDGTAAYNGQNSNFHPLARIGPPAFGLTGEAIKFWSNSQAITGSITSHSWVFPSGSPSSSSSAGSAGSPINVTWSAATGHIPHYIRYTATASNGRTHTRYNPVWVMDEIEDAYCALEIESISGSTDSGTWRMQIRVYDAATTSEFPSEAMVVIVAEDFYAGQKVSIGGNWDHRENIVFMGWIVRGTTFLDTDDGSVTFEAVGPVGKLNQLISWPANLVYKTSPSAWNEIAGMTCDRAAFHILTERSTMDHICDINLTGNTKILRYVDIPETHLQSQLNEYCLSPIGARVLSDRQGQIYLSRNPNLRPLGERSSIPTVMEIELDDIRNDPGLELGEEEQEKQVSQVDFIAFTYNGEDVEPLYSLAPGNQFETGTVEKIDGVRADDQTEANVLSGMYLADLNNTFREVQTPTWNMRVFDIAPEEYVTLSLAATDTRRGIVWDSQKLIPRSVDIGFDMETRSIRVNPTLEKDSFGPPGIGGGYPKSVPKAKPVNLVPKPPGGAILAWNGFFIRHEKEDAWSERGDLETVVNGCLDPWWFTPAKADSQDPDKAILFACGASGLIKRSDNGGYTWKTQTPSDPPNTWSDSTAPTLDDVEFVWIRGDVFNDGVFYALARWQETDSGNDLWRGWLLVTTSNDFASSTWYPLYDGATLPDQIQPIALDNNQFDLLITVWQDDGSNTDLILQRWDPSGIAYVSEQNLGSASAAQVSARTRWAVPWCVPDTPKLWHLFGAMSSPVGLSGNHQIIKSEDGGGVWTALVTDWDLCSNLIISRANDNGDREYYATREYS